MMRVFKLSLLLVLLMTISLSPRNAEGQMALLGVSKTDVIAGDVFYAFYNITTTKDKPIVEFELTIIAPSGWRVVPYRASGITMGGKDIEVKWNDSRAFYKGEGASLAQVSFIIWIPPQERGLKSLEASGYIVFREGSENRKQYVVGSKQVNVHPWEPMIFLNLSKKSVIPPAILKASLRVLTAPPLYPTDMRNVVVRVEDTIKGIIYQESREYWPYGTVMDAQFSLEVPQNAPGGKQKVSVTVEYEVFGERLSTTVDYPYEIIKQSNLVIEKVEVPQEARLGEPLAVNVVLVNPSSFEAYDVEVHAQMGEDRQSKKVGNLDPGAYSVVNLTFKPSEIGVQNISIWAVWTQEYPRSTNATERKVYEVKVEAGSALDSGAIALLIIAVVLAGAAIKYALKRRRTEELKGEA